MLVFLAGQLATVPHAHGANGEDEPLGHDAHTHTHMSWFGHSHGPSHHHQDDSNAPSHGSSLDSSTAEQPDHDSDAVYLPDKPTAPLTGSSVTHHEGLRLNPVLSVPVLPLLLPASLAATDVSLLSQCSSARPLYLTLRALRI